ncbi:MULTISPECIES: LysR family transcriptional regulator [Anaerofustis]|uniref:LysR family transcriptional regulator n=1 Tax=Anaerofustis TaxID=264995 RepID=UPI0011067E07|nr:MULTISPECIES: LysR family transcriptional regulator [Anaerofustis]MCO8194495.1 LysR family transcriptional regulator [Anaerofustis sp. NSJ-163]
MLLKQIYYFTKIVQTGSFTLAAEECYISQSAISQQIKALESELGVELLKRKNRGFSLTSAGKYFYKEGLILLEKAEEIKQETIAIAKNKRNYINFGYLNNYEGDRLKKAIIKFTSIYPNTDLNLISGNHEDLYENLRDGKVDIVLNDQRRAFSDNYVNQYLFSNKYFIEVSKTHPLSNNEFVTMQDLKPYTCIIISSQKQENNEQLFYKDILNFKGETIFAKNKDESKLFISANRGFRLCEKENKENNNLKTIPLFKDNKQMEIKYYAFWKKDNKKYDLIEDFAKMLLN